MCAGQEFVLSQAAHQQAGLPAVRLGTCSGLALHASCSHFGPNVGSPAACRSCALAVMIMAPAAHGVLWCFLIRSVQCARYGAHLQGCMRVIYRLDSPVSNGLRG